MFVSSVVGAPLFSVLPALFEASPFEVLPALFATSLPVLFPVVPAFSLFEVALFSVPATLLLAVLFSTVSALCSTSPTEYPLFPEFVSVPAFLFCDSIIMDELLLPLTVDAPEPLPPLELLPDPPLPLLPPLELPLPEPPLELPEPPLLLPPELPLELVPLFFADD